MRRASALVLALVLLAAPVAALAAVSSFSGSTGVTVAVDSGITSPTAASGTSGPVRVSGPNRYNWQLCGTGLSGTYTVKAGSTSSTVATIWTVTLTTYTGCTENVSFDPAEWSEFSWTRSAGSADSLRLTYFPK